MSYFYTSAYLKGDSVYLRGYQNGKPFKEVMPAAPYLFVAGNGPYKTLNGKSCEKICFDTIKESKEFAADRKQTFKNVSNSDAGEVYGLPFPLYTFLNDEFSGQIEYDPEAVARGSIDIETKSDTGFPNADEADKEIVGITLSRTQNKQRKIVMFGCGVYKPSMPGVKYVMCRDEKEMLEVFLNYWEDDDWSLDIITGWNIDGFDIKYIVNRVRRILGEEYIKRLSPWRIVKEREITRGKSAARGGKNIADRVDTVYELVGIAVLDYLELYKKFSFQNHESYKLDYIAWVELGERKLDYSEYGSLHEFYLKDYQRFMDYNLDDTIKIDKLDEKLKLIDLVMALAYDAKVTYQDTMTTTRPWDVIIHNYLMEQNIVVPQYENTNDGFTLVGGYVKDVIPGLYKWVVSLDLNSLYPHLIMQYNISPETLVGKHDFSGPDEMNRDSLEAALSVMLEGLQTDNVAMAGNGCLYSREEMGFLPALMLKMYDDRVVYKDLMIQAKKDFERTKDPQYEKLISRYHNLQMAKKLQLNSAYGALANEWFRWFNINNAEAVTMSGQMAIRWIEKYLNIYINKILGTSGVDYIIAIDTDSVYLCLDAFVDRVGLSEAEPNKVVNFLDEVVKTKIEPYIDKCYENLAHLTNSMSQKMKMKRESIANKGIWKAKKMYILNVWDKEGVRFSEPKIEMKGIEAVRSSTPMVVRDAIKKSLGLIMNKEEQDLQDFVDEFKVDFYKRPFEEIAFPRGINMTECYPGSTDKNGNLKDVAPNGLYTKGAGPAVKGAFQYNRLIDELGLENKYEKIFDTGKGKFAYLKTPNPIRDGAISTPGGALPEEFDLHRYVDYDSQFEKAFLNPITSITEVMGWKAERTLSLESFFG